MACAAPPHGQQEIRREDMEAAIAKAVELRALHVALLQGSAAAGSPASLRFLSPSSAAGAGASPSLSRASLQYSAMDYPVFTPSYEEEPLPGYHFLHSESQTLSDSLSRLGLEGEEKDKEAYLFDNGEEKKYSSMNREQQICSMDTQEADAVSCINHVALQQSSPAIDILRYSRRTGSGEFKIVTTCNKCKPATINREVDGDNKNHKSIIQKIPAIDAQTSLQSHPKHRGPILSWLFPRSKKKPKSEMSPNTLESEDMSQLFKDWGMYSLESLKKELVTANENRDAALAEVGEMRSSLEELKQKLLHLETYCEELKKALKQAMQGKDAQAGERHNLSKRTKSIAGGRDSTMPVSHEVMVEGFLQIVSEARLSVKQFCKTLVSQINDTDSDLIEKLNVLLQLHHLTLNSRYSKGVLYHLEALINQTLYHDFENCVFQKNGSPKVLDPQQDRVENFSAFVALRNLSWNEVLRKGTKYYSEDFSRFCDQKMSCVVSLLDWSRPWPEQLLQSFFVAAKCIWLLHLLAFSFSPPLTILRVDENRSFDPLYMEDVLLDRQRAQAPARVKVMVMPGFYVQDRVLRCKVLCRYRSVA